MKDYNDKVISNQKIAIGIAMHNNDSTIRRCLTSALNQKNCKRELIFVLANDNSSDRWKEQISDLINDSRIIYLDFLNNDAVKTRNMINDYIKTEIKNPILIGRLDADDEYASPTVLSEIEKIFDTEKPDLILAGNYLRKNGKIIERKNIAVKKFAKEEYILERLKKMSEDNPEGELPSCNMFFKPEIMKPYPNIKSGEDHALLVYYLMRQDEYKIFFAENLLLTIYNLDGVITSDNKKKEIYIDCRKNLYCEALNLKKSKK